MAKYTEVKTLDVRCSQFGIPEPPKSSIYQWASRFPPKAAAIERTGQKPKTGPEWVADELQVVVGGRPMWLWNVMDAKTRFLLATHLAPYRGAREATVVLRKAREASATRPERVKTDRLRSYDQGMHNVFAGDSVVKHVKADGIRAEVNNNMSERLQGTFRDRLRILRGLKSAVSGQRCLDGWALNYNYFRIVLCERFGLIATDDERAISMLPRTFDTQLATNRARAARVKIIKPRDVRSRLDLFTSRAARWLLFTSGIRG